MEPKELIPHLFRTEFSKITAVLCKYFGVTYLETAEDIASETFFAAMETWPHRGIPENPVGWLYSVAKNKARNAIHHQKIFAEKVALHVKEESQKSVSFEIDLSEKNIADSQLQMLFAICHPSLPAEAQIGLALRILCGFGIDEIASAFLTNKETVNKRLYRARENLRKENVKIEFPGPQVVHQRLDTVLTTLYLLFNEGYYSENRDPVLREDLCLEAMRLAYLLVENPSTAIPAAYALLALMCFHSSRFEARKKGGGETVLYDDQDESLWNQELIAKGGYFLRQASQGTTLSKYHLEATIAWWHTQKEDTKEKWESILHLYNQLLVREYSPVAALNRTFVLFKVYTHHSGSPTDGKEKAVAEAEKLKLLDNHYYFALLGELYTGIDDEKAKLNFQKALNLARSQTDKKTLQGKLEELPRKSNN